MRLGIRLFLYALPFAIPFGTWQLAVLANDYLHCSAIGKDRLPCIVMGIDIQFWLGLAPLGMLLWWPGLLISGLLVGEYLGEKLPTPWGKRPRVSARRK
jgi:hypothetical protein